MRGLLLILDKDFINQPNNIGFLQDGIYNRLSFTNQDTLIKCSAEVIMIYIILYLVMCIFRLFGQD